MKKYDNITQGSPEWLQKKKGVMTGTVLKSIMGTAKARQDAFYDAIAERLTVGIEEEYENPMDRGIRLESEAVAAFEFETGKKTTQVGFLEDDNNPLIGNSPDRLVGDDAALEVKCPLGKNYVKLWLTNEVPDEYEWQVVQYFVVNENLKTLYFAGYNPDIPLHPLHVIEIKRELIAPKIDLARQSQEEFIREVNAMLEKLMGNDPILSQGEDEGADNIMEATEPSRTKGRQIKNTQHNA